MPPAVTIGQKWAAWIPGRQQWLLATVVRREHESITLRCDERYGIAAGGDLQADEETMLENRNLFRFVEV
jgi:hypothetical protein